MNAVNQINSFVFAWKSQGKTKKAVASELSVLNLVFSLAIAFLIVLLGSVILSTVYYSLKI